MADDSLPLEIFTKVCTRKDAHKHFRNFKRISKKYIQDLNPLPGSGSYVRNVWVASDASPLPTEGPRLMGPRAGRAGQQGTHPTLPRNCAQQNHQHLLPTTGETRLFSSASTGGFPAEALRKEVQAKGKSIAAQGRFLAETFIFNIEGQVESFRPL